MTSKNTQRSSGRAFHPNASSRVIYHEAGAQQQAVQRLGHISSVDVAVVRIVVFAVSSLQSRQELSQARDGDLPNAAAQPSRVSPSRDRQNNKKKAKRDRINGCLCISRTSGKIIVRLGLLFSLSMSFSTGCYSSAMRSRDKDLKAAVEPVSGDQFKDQRLQRVVAAG